MLPLLPRLLDAKIENYPNRIADLHSLYKGRQYRKAYHRKWYYQYPGGIEKDDSKLKSISIAINNWEREYYLPYVIDMYYHQDYPKELIEIIVVDENSSNKDMVLNLMKLIAYGYNDIKIRYIQLHENNLNNGVVRANAACRAASNEIIISGASDTIVLGTNFLRGVCYTHNLIDMLYGVPMAYSFNVKNEEELNDLTKLFCSELVPHIRLAQEYAISIEAKYFKKMHGFMEHAGYGGHETNFVKRFVDNGGSVFANTAIMSAELPNFATRPAPKNIARRSFRNLEDWIETFVYDNPDWGTTKSMVEYNLYEGD